MDKGGRPKNPIWADFWCVREGSKTMAKCKFCSHIMGGKAARMKIHLSKCKREKPVIAPNAVQSEAENFGTVQGNKSNGASHVKRASIGSAFKTTAAATIDIESSKSEDECDDPPMKASKRPRLLQDDLQHFVVQTSSKMKNELDLQVAKFFYSCNIPFSVVEQAEFLTLMQKLRPGYKPPSRKALSENLLNDVTTSLQNDMVTALENKECTIMQDGWSNIHNDPVIATCLHTDGKSYFLNAEECGSNKKTAEYCKMVTDESIKLAEEKYKAKVISVVTDNENKMNKLRELLVEERSELIVYGCTAHWLNLLAQDISPAAVIKHVVEIQKYFRNHHQPAGWLKEFPDTVKPQLPNETRWNSQTECISTFIKNRAAYLSICEDHESDIDSKIRRLLNDYNLFQKVKDLFQQLKVISKALNNLQSDEATIADACHEWLNLADSPELKPHKDVVLKRMDSALEPFHFLAAMTDPSSKNDKMLKESQKEIAREWLMSLMPNAFSLLLSYEAQEKPFPSSFFKTKDVKAKVWWKALSNKEICPEFINLMVKLHSVPCSSASIERIFSNFSYIHNKLRNRLGVQKAAKLVFCYRMLRGQKDLDW